jgi:hypothetical protein
MKKFVFLALLAASATSAMALPKVSCKITCGAGGTASCSLVPEGCVCICKF